MSEAAQVRDCLCLHTRRSARMLTQFYADALRGSGLRVTQFTLLATIEEMGPVGQQPLADMMGMDRTTLTRNLGLLERDGLAVVAQGKQDRRENEIRLTAAGVAAVRRARPMWQAAQEAMVTRLAGSKAGYKVRAKALAGTLEGIDRLAVESET